MQHICVHCELSATANKTPITVYKLTENSDLLLSVAYKMQLF